MTESAARSSKRWHTPRANDPRANAFDFNHENPRLILTTRTICPATCSSTENPDDDNDGD